MIPATTSKFVLESLKADDATQSTLQESEMSIIEEESFSSSAELKQVHRNATTAQSTFSTGESTFDGPHSITLGDLSVFSNLSMDMTLDKASHLDAPAGSDTTIAGEFIELLVSWNAKEPEKIIYYCAVVMCLSKYFTILDMLLAAVIVVYIQSEKSPSLDQFLRRLHQVLCSAIQDAVQNTIPHSAVCYLLARRQTPANLSSSLEKRFDELSIENKELKSQLESEKWQVKSLQDSLSRKETILETEVVNRATFEQSSELVQTIHDHEKTQLEETVKRLKIEIESQTQAMELMEAQAVQRDELLQSILLKFERNEASLSRKSRRRSEPASVISNGNSPQQNKATQAL
ncbi:unnamed protein product [Cylindrotheca closterium]|uniref:Uncharacterized protein n=1 Tax=Cylindrotheca closterium TaxID=2856 RepID=A0AAD2FDU9_9STRA|nr:unnamed protein product [Cylindrotheca closterium]